jgi:hypothetical protein
MSVKAIVLNAQKLHDVTLVELMKTNFSKIRKISKTYARIYICDTDACYCEAKSLMITIASKSKLDKI